MMGSPDSVAIDELRDFHYTRARGQLNDADSADIAIAAHKISDMLDASPVGSVAMHIYKTELLAICDIQSERAAARENQHRTTTAQQPAGPADTTQHHHDDHHDDEADSADMPAVERRHITLTGDETRPGTDTVATLAIGPHRDGHQPVTLALDIAGHEARATMDARQARKLAHHLTELADLADTTPTT